MINSKNVWYICKKKSFSNHLEKSIKNLIESFNFNVNLNHTNGIDLKVSNDKNQELKIEIKSCFTYRFRNYHSKKIRIGVFTLKSKELIEVDYYIFIKINNLKNNINYIDSFEVYLINIYDIIDYINKNNINTSNELYWISIKQFDKIKKENLLDILQKGILE